MKKDKKELRGGANRVKHPARAALDYFYEESRTKDMDGLKAVVYNQFEL